MSRDHVVAMAYHNGLYLILRQGSALDADAECLVNAANEQMRHGGGIALEIAQEAGQQLSAECEQWVRINGEIRPGAVALTESYNLNSKFKKIIHAVGPKQEGQDGRNMLISTLVNSMKLAEINQFSSISIPALSVGIFGFPKDSSAERHYESFIIFAGYAQKIQYLKKIIINVFTDEEAEVFADKFLEFSDNFQYSEFIGTIKQLGISLYHYYCKTCQTCFDSSSFQLTNCCFSCCDYCISKQNSGICFNCRIPVNQQTAGYWKCIKCKQAFDKSNGFICPTHGAVYQLKFKLNNSSLRK